MRALYEYHWVAGADERFAFACWPDKRAAYEGWPYGTMTRHKCPLVTTCASSDASITEAVPCFLSDASVQASTLGAEPAMLQSSRDILNKLCMCAKHMDFSRQLELHKQTAALMEGEGGSGALGYCHIAACVPGWV